LRVKVQCSIVYISTVIKRR